MFCQEQFFISPSLLRPGQCPARPCHSSPARPMLSRFKARAKARARATRARATRGTLTTTTTITTTQATITSITITTAIGVTATATGPTTGKPSAASPLARSGIARRRSHFTAASATACRRDEASVAPHPVSPGVFSISVGSVGHYVPEKSTSLVTLRGALLTSDRPELTLRT
jgi:hypothetical protein